MAVSSSAPAPPWGELEHPSQRVVEADRRLVAKVAHAGGVEELMARGIEAQHFADLEARAVFEFCCAHTIRWGSSPSLTVIKEKFPQRTFEIVTEPLGFCLERFVTEVKRREAIEALRSIGDVIDRGNEDELATIDEAFLERARKLATAVPSPRIGRYSTMIERIKEYHAAVKTGALTGVPFGIKTIDELTLGIQPHEFVAVAGWKGTGKSTLIHHVLFNAYMAGKQALLFSLEMEKAAVFRKFDVMATHVRHYAMKAGSMDKAEIKLWETAAKRAAGAKNDIVVIDDVGRCSVERVYADTVRYAPDIVAVDYLSLMSSREGQQMWERITQLTMALKQNARALKVPVFVAAQTNIGGFSEGATLGNIAYSQSIGQDADIVIGLHQDEAMKSQRRMEVRLLKNRDGETRNATLRWDMTTMSFEEVDTAQLFAVKRP